MDGWRSQRNRFDPVCSTFFLLLWSSTVIGRPRSEPRFKNFHLTLRKKSHLSCRAPAGKWAPVAKWPGPCGWCEVWQKWPRRSCRWRPKGGWPEPWPSFQPPRHFEVSSFEVGTAWDALRRGGSRGKLPSTFFSRKHQIENKKWK